MATKDPLDEIGVGEEFYSWLLTEEKNGGGAIIDFGCYGANLVTWVDGWRTPHISDGRYTDSQGCALKEMSTMKPSSF